MSKSRIYFLASAGCTFIIGGYGWAASGRLNGPVVFMAISTALLATTLWLIFRAARSLTAELRPEVTATGRRRKELEREKQSLLKAIKEIEFDHEMGKVSEADFREIGGVYRARAVRILRQLDDGDDYRRLVERDLAVRLKRPVPPAAARRLQPTCSACATENDADAAFCKKCGQKLEQEAKAVS